MKVSFRVLGRCARVEQRLDILVGYFDMVALPGALVNVVAKQRSRSGRARTQICDHNARRPMSPLPEATRLLARVGEAFLKAILWKPEAVWFVYIINWQSLRLQTVPGNGACLRHCPSEGQCLRAGALGRLSPKVTFVSAAAVVF